MSASHTWNMALVGPVEEWMFEADAVEFLRGWLPPGPWHLISLMDGPPRFASFARGQEREANDWIQRENADRNIYFAPNPLLREPANGKAKKEDIALIVALHVDIDPAPDADWQAERQRILALLTDNLPEGVPPPSVIVDSGGGYQAFWMLRQPVEVGGDVAKAAAVERHTRWLEERFGADHCHNVDRIMRLPGTINHPNAKKIAVGRVDAPARVIDWNDTEFDLSDFGEVEAVRTPSQSEEAADFPLNHAAVPDLSVLPISVHPRTIDTIKNGHKPGADRSKDVYRVTMDLLQNRVAPETVFAILTDEAWPIHESIAEKGDRDAIVTIKRCMKTIAGEVAARAQTLPTGALLPAVFADEAPSPAPTRVSIDDTVDVSPGKEDEALERIHEILAAKDVPLFQRGGELVTPIVLSSDQVDNDTGITRHTGSLILHRPPSAGLLSILVKHCRFERYAGEEKGMVRAAAPKTIAEMFAQGRERWSRLRTLDGIASVPLFRSDGTILQKPGYDPHTRLWFHPGGCRFDPVPENPTREDALRALAVLWRPFSKYPIQNPACRAALLSDLLSVFVAPIVDAVPGLGITAAAPGFGKTKIAESIGALAMGCKVATVNQASSEEEMNKILDSMLLAGDQVLCITNVENSIGGPRLCSIITGASYKPRVLGKSSTPNIASKVMLIFDGNNLAFRADITRRVLLTEIRDDEVEVPQSREFAFDPVDLTLQTRPAMVAAGLTILRAWHVAGRPKPDGHKPLGSFEGWEPVRLALLWIGEADPVDTMDLIQEDDPEREASRALLDLLMQAKGRETFRASDLQSKCGIRGSRTALGDALLGAEDWNAKSVGQALHSLQGRWIDGVRLVRVKNDTARGHIYRVEVREDRA